MDRKAKNQYNKDNICPILL